MNNQTFQKFYNRLNPAQKRAVDLVEGPVMVVAGPGTGKTEILTLRIANILQKADVQPENILALTFTDSGVISMRRRLVEIIGSPAYSVAISTFHTFCNDIIKNYPEEFPRIISSNNITEVDQIQIIESLINELPLKELKPFGDIFYFLRPVLGAINDLKREGVNPDTFSNIVEKEQKDFDAIPGLTYEKGPHKGKMKGQHQKREKQIKKNRELAHIYHVYQETLTKSRFYDYTDMIMEALSALEKNKNLLLVLQEQYQYILVDEHQDTNNAQNRILELLSSFHKNPNVFIVGDEKQAIFRFQGASLENFAYFRKRYPNAELLILEENYRSSQAILDSAHSLIAGEKELKAAVPRENKKIELLIFSNPIVETYFLARDVKEKIAQGIVPEEIAIFYRDNKDAVPVAAMLEKNGISFSVESDQDILRDPDIKKLLLLFRAIHQFGAQDVFIEALHIDFLEIDPLDIYKLVEYANENRITVFELARSAERMKALGLTTEAHISTLYSRLAQWFTASRNQSFPEVFTRVVRESGFLASLLSRPDSAEKLEKVNRLFGEVKTLIEKHKDCSLGDFIAYLDTLSSYSVMVKKSAATRLTGRVRLMTAHRSKGLEFDYVYIIHAVDGHWGNKRRAQLLSLPPRVFSLTDSYIHEGNTIDDERRLFYVALTRAKQGVYISYAVRDENEREQLPSQFIQEINPELIQTCDTTSYEKEFASKKEILFAPSLVSGIPIKDREYVRELFLKRGLSVTALNNYLSCPWKYFYTNLLRVPQSPTKHQMYGIAIHAALKDFFDAIKSREAKEDFLLARFLDHLTKQPLTKTEFEEVLERGKQALNGYYHYYRNIWSLNMIGEFTIRGIMLTPEIRLTGKIDKMEILNDRLEVNVVDYKTGRPKTRGEIEGSTKNSNGDIKRQLVFYNLLLNLYEKGKYRMVSGDIDFVEPDKTGRYRKEHIVIEKEDVHELSELINKISEEILMLAFWDRRCENKTCEFCALRDMMI